MSNLSAEWAALTGIPIVGPNPPTSADLTSRTPDRPRKQHRRANNSSSMLLAPPAKPDHEVGNKFALPALADARDGVLGNFPLTELGTAHRFLAEHGKNLRFVPELKSWIVWDTDHWIWDQDGSRVRCVASLLYLVIYREGVVASRGEDVRYLDWARKCQTAKTINAIVTLASDQPSIRVSIDDVDGNQLIVGIDGGRRVVNLRTGLVRAAERSDLVTRSLQVEEIGSPSEAHRWRRFIDEVFLGDPQLIDWLQRLLGYCLTGLTSEHLFVFAYGAGANGKSVLFSRCTHLWGDYARTIQPETLMAQTRTSSGPSPDIARLSGARLVLASETEEGRPLAEALIKQLTGGDRITARDMYARPFEFEPRLKLMLAGNHRPKINGTDNGIWRRVRLLPFGRVFAPHEQERDLDALLREESPHIAAWLIEGCRNYIARGLADVPACIKDATSTYRREEDLVGLWRNERTDQAGDTQGSVLYADFGHWCSANGHKAATVQAFGRRLGQLGHERRHTRGGASYADISLRGVML